MTGIPDPTDAKFTEFQLRCLRKRWNWRPPLARVVHWFGCLSIDCHSPTVQQWLVRSYHSVRSQYDFQNWTCLSMSQLLWIKKVPSDSSPCLLKTVARGTGQRARIRRLHSSSQQGAVLLWSLTWWRVSSSFQIFIDLFLDLSDSFSHFGFARVGPWNCWTPFAPAPEPPGGQQGNGSRSGPWHPRVDASCES